MKCPECGFGKDEKPTEKDAVYVCVNCGCEFSPYPIHPSEYRAILRDLIRATNGAQINPRFPIGAGMAAQIQAVAERARILIEGK